MRSATSIGTLIMLILWATAAQFAEAGGFWRFNVSVDERPAFTGGIGVGDESSDRAY